jgi:release factor glutamine methyltransferase
MNMTASILHTYPCLVHTVQAAFKAYPLPRLEQLALAAHALNVPRSWLLAHDTDALNTQQWSALNTVLQRRLAGEPVAYIIGQREFYGLILAVSPAVLIPRPETELLVDWLVANVPPNGRVLDLGTGSGAIALAFAYHRRDCTVYASDISEAALSIAAVNISTHSLSHSANTPLVSLRCSDWCSAFSILQYAEYFDVIVSNPPYIAADDAHLQQGDLRYEPITALSDARDGLQHYSTIATQALPRLNASGVLVLEHGWQQSAAITQLLETAQYHAITPYYDAAKYGELGNARMLVARKMAL